MGDNLMDFSERCRLCIEPKRLSINIFSEEGRRIKLKSKINKNLPLKVSQSDGLPNQVCYQCLYRLETWVSFKQLCMERDQVMKTWSQSCINEASCQVQENSGDQKNCKVGKNGKTKDSNTSPTSRLHPNSLESLASHDDFSSGNHIDDAKSDTSVWEVVKVNDPDNMESESPDRDISQSFVDIIDSADYKHEGKEDKGQSKHRKPSKVQSSGSDSSIGSNVGTSSQELISQPMDGVVFSSNLPSYKLSSKNKDRTGAVLSPSPLKRKRGRPSKASLQRDRELKKLREQEKVISKGNLFPTSEVVTDHVNEPVTEPLTGNDQTSELNIYCNDHSDVITPEFIPIERDGGCGVTEVVLDDPDFGSMKFTLSVVAVGSPTSSPISSDSLNYYSCAPGSVNISTDSLHPEDFEGFESPNCSSFMKPPYKHDPFSSSEEISRPQSQADMRIVTSDNIRKAGIKRKHRSSVSGDLSVKCSFADEPGVKNHMKPFSNTPSIHSLALKKQHRSRSFEDLKAVVDIKRTLSEDRNAFSDGEYY